MASSNKNSKFEPISYIKIRTLLGKSAPYMHSLSTDVWYEGSILFWNSAMGSSPGGGREYVEDDSRAGAPITAVFSKYSSAITQLVYSDPHIILGSQLTVLIS